MTVSSTTAVPFLALLDNPVITATATHPKAVEHHILNIQDRCVSNSGMLRVIVYGRMIHIVSHSI